MMSLATGLQEGFASVTYSGGMWYRMLAVPKPRATAANIARVNVIGVRARVKMQKRRLVPFF